MTVQALRLTAGDFEAARSERGGAAVLRRRVEFGQRALAWAKGIATRLASLGLVVEIRTSEHPASGKRMPDGLWVAFFRDRGARDRLEAAAPTDGQRRRAAGETPLHFRHPSLGLHIDGQRVEVSVEVRASARLDAEQLRARLADATSAGEIVDAVAALPIEFTIGAIAGRRSPCTKATRESIARTLESALAGGDGLFIGWSIPRELALEHAELLGEQLGDALVSLAPVYRLVTWTPEHRPASPPPYAKGERVKVLGGPFAGKTGLVAALDGKGHVRVMLGLLSTRVEIAHLAPAAEARGRPSLQSSHRHLPTPKRLRATTARH